MNENELATSADAGAIAEMQADIARLMPQSETELARFKAITKSGDWLPRLSLICGTSRLFKLNKLPKGAFAAVTSETDYTNLGESVDCIPLLWRIKAIDMSGDGTPIQVYDEKSEAFQEIQAKSTLPNSNCAWGPEFLVWVPAAQSFTTLHMGSKTARPEAKKMRELIGKGMTLKCRVIDDGKNIWEAIDTYPCSTPIGLPPSDVRVAAMEKFTKEAATKAPEKALNTGRAR